MSQHEEYLVGRYGDIFRDLLGGEFIMRSRRQREEFIAAIRNSQSTRQPYTALILGDADMLERKLRNIGPGQALRYALYYNYFLWIDEVVRIGIEQFDPEIPPKYIAEVFALFDARAQPPSRHQPEYPRDRYDYGAGGGQYEVQSIRRTPSQGIHLGANHAAPGWTQTPASRAPYNIRSEGVDGRSPPNAAIPEVTNRLVELTRHSVVFTTHIINKEGIEVNSEEHSKFHDDVVVAKNKDIDLAIPTIPLGAVTEENADEQQLRSLITPKGLRLVDIILEPPEDDGDNTVMGRPITWFTSLDRETLTYLVSEKGTHLYTDVAVVESQIRVMNSKLTETIARALREAGVGSISSILSGLIEHGSVHPIDVVFIRNDIITSINNTLGSVLGLSPASYFKTLDELTPKDSATNILEVLSNAIRKKSSSPIIEYLDIPAELTHAVKRIIGKVEIVGEDIVLTRRVGVGYLSRNLADLKFGDSVLKHGYITTSMDSLQEITDVVRQKIQDHGEFHLLTRDGYMLVLTTSAKPTRGSRDDVSGGILFVRIDGINAVNNQLHDIAMAIA